MKKIFFSTFLVFALVFSFGNPANAQVSSDQTILQNLYQQLDAIRIQLGGLVSREAVKSVIPVTTTPTTAYVFNACNGTSQSTFDFCMEVCSDAGGSWGVSSGSDGASQGCYTASRIAMPQNGIPTATAVRGVVDITENNARTNPSCPAGQIWSVSIGACVLGPITVSPTASVVDVTGSPLDKENLQDDRLMPTVTQRPGMSGESVKQVQNALVKLGYLHVLQVSSTYDNLTQQAVRNFQMKNNLGADGVAGPATFAVMNRLIANMQNNSDSSLVQVGNTRLPAHVAAQINAMIVLAGDGVSVYKYNYTCTVSGIGGGTYPMTSHSDLGDSFGGTINNNRTYTCVRAVSS